ncbi:8-oxo-dGTP diphosphatase [Candidatus Uhrbacteria bacterium]|nr:8-oxo-dGTP diphosphatase [Candidatus Uhrbacteria bacterium]
MRRTTLCYPVVHGKVLLAMKKRGFGAGKWNGPGGKVQDGETIEQACRRETEEEVGVALGELEDRGVVRFVFECRPEWDNECRIFVARDVIGEPTETEEMRPAWYPIDGLPFAEMWEDDAIWLDGVLGGGTVDATFWFDADGRMLRWEKR